MAFRNGKYLTAPGPVVPVEKSTHKGWTRNLADIDKEYIEKVKPKNPNRNILANFPVLVDSINLYHRTAWITDGEYRKLRNRWGNRVIIIRRCKPS